jgi:hypothetical protein
LRQELAYYAALFAQEDAPGKAFAYSQLAHWEENPDLSPLHDANALAAFPDDEREEWQQLWADVDALLKSARAKK